MNLQEKYEVSSRDVFLASAVRNIKGSRTCPEFLYRYSLKKYGFKDNLARYYTENILIFLSVNIQMGTSILE